MVEILSSESFFEKYPRKMYYAGFMKSAQAWFPFCFISDNGGGENLDTLFLSTSYPALDELVKAYAERIPGVETTFVQYLLREEIENILRGYSLDKVAIELPEDGGCGCGCGCS